MIIVQAGINPNEGICKEFKYVHEAREFLNSMGFSYKGNWGAGMEKFEKTIEYENNGKKQSINMVATVSLDGLFPPYYKCNKCGI